MMRFLIPAMLAGLSLASVRAGDPVPLFDGKSLAGWVVDGSKEFKDGETMKPCWEARDGRIICHGRGFGFLRHEKEFADFELHVEYRFDPPAAPTRGRGNSGIGIRTCVFDPKVGAATRPSFFSYEVQVYDDPPGKMPDKHSNMSLYRYVAPTKQATRPSPEWNEVLIRCVGPRIRITLNGQDVLDVDQTTIPEISRKPLKGYVCLQNHGSHVEFRTIRLKELTGN